MYKVSRRTELLTLRKPTKIHKLIESVPKPRNSVPKSGLPLWSALPIDAKLPIFKAPKNETVLTREKLGKKLWRSVEKPDFILDDPLCINVSYHYESIHDQNLRRFFMNKINRKRMFELGLVTKDGDAICNLKDYNNYRRYLRRINQDIVERERKDFEETERQRMLLTKARENEEKQLMIQGRFQMRKKKMFYLNQQREMAAQQKQEARNESLRQYDERLVLIEKKKMEDTRRRMDKSYEFEMKIRQRNQTAQDMERKRKIHFLRKWHDSDVHRRKRLAREKLEKKNETEKNVLHHWTQKVDTQLARMSRQRYLLDRYDRNMTIKAEARRREFENRRLLVDERLMKLKAEHVREYSDNIWSIKGMVKALTKAWEQRLKNKSPEERKREKSLIEKTIQLQIAEFKHKSEGKEVLAILKGAKKKLDAFFGLPEPVTDFVEQLLNRSIRTYVLKKVERIFAEAPEHAEQYTKQQEAALREHERKKEAHSGHRTSIRPIADIIQSARNRSLTLGHSNPMTDSTLSMRGQPHRLVSFGSISKLEKSDTNKELMVLHSIKDRPPTPVPSLTELMEAVFGDPEQGDQEVERDIEKVQLDYQLADFSKQLVSLVVQKADNQLDNKKKILFRQLSHQNIDTEMAMSHIVDAILHEENPKLMDMIEVDQLADILSKEVILKRTVDQFVANLPGKRNAKHGSKHKKVLSEEPEKKT